MGSTNRALGFELSQVRLHTVLHPAWVAEAEDLEAIVHGARCDEKRGEGFFELFHHRVRTLR